MLNSIFNINLSHYLILAFLLFLIGAFGVIVARNVIKVLISVEFMLTAVNINFIAFATFSDSIQLTGYIFNIFYIAIGSIEVAIALIIFYLMYREKKSVDMDKYKELKG